VDNPHANKLTIHILAAVAEHEQDAITNSAQVRGKARSAAKSWSSAAFSASM
jgi:hypothetical protein